MHNHHRVTDTDPCRVHDPLPSLRVREPLESTGSKDRLDHPPDRGNQMAGTDNPDRLHSLDPELLSALIDTPYECPIVVDRDGFICYVSRYSSTLIDIEPSHVLGKHITEVIKDTNLHEVLETGKAKIGVPLHIGGRHQIIARIPLRNSEGKLIGAVGKGMFSSASKVGDLHLRLELLNGQVKYYQKAMSDLKGGSGIVGNSELIQKVRKRAQQASTNNAAVLITGSSGTGKEVIAFTVHRLSKRGEGPFVRINCAAIPRSSSKASCSATKKAPFPGPVPRESRENSSWPTGAPSCSMKSETCLSTCRRNCSGPPGA